MSYYIELVLLAKVRKDRQRQIKSELDHPPRYDAGGLATFVGLLAMRDGGTLCFKSKGHPFWSDYDVDDEDGLLDALNAPWSDTEEIASWIAQYVTSSSRIIFHSFLPNSLHNVPGIVVNTAFWAANRANWANRMLVSMGFAPS
jgi:hypothetical protein